MRRRLGCGIRRNQGLGPFEIPEWFKSSFLDINDDATEAAEEGRHLMVFFHLENCPYCQRTLDDSFVEGTPEAEFIARHIDVVAIDVHGDLEVTAGGETYTEREYSRAVGARFTPTIIAYDPDGQAIIRVVGYRSPEAFAHVLSYVKDKVYAGEEHLDFNDYVEMRKKVKWAMPDNERFERIEDLSAVGKPLMLVIEDGGCESDCEVLHERLLPQEDAQEYLDRLVVVRIDASSDAPIIAPDGSRTTDAELARKIGIKYRPGIAFCQAALTHELLAQSKHNIVLCLLSCTSTRKNPKSTCPTSLSATRPAPAARSWTHAWTS